MLVALAWQPELSGLAAIDLTYTGNDAGGTANGTVALTHAKFNVLPGLGKVTTMVGLPDLSGVEGGQGPRPTSRGRTARCT